MLLISHNFLSMTLFFITYSRERRSKFMSSVSEMLVKKCHTAMIIHYMDISYVMVHSQLLEGET